MDRKIAEIMDWIRNHHHRYRPDPWRVHPQRDRETSAVFPPRQLAAYAGIDPTMRQSGEYNGVRNRIPNEARRFWLAASSALIRR